MSLDTSSSQITREDLTDGELIELVAATPEELPDSVLLVQGGQTISFEQIAAVEILERRLAAVGVWRS